MGGILKGYLQEHLEVVRGRLEQFCSCELTEADELTRLATSREGKLIRPSLVILSGLCLEGLNDDHYTIAAVIEMFHIASLLHDDVLDKADTRRHEPSVNYLFGNKAAVLLGDLLVACAVKAAATVERPGEPEGIVDIVSSTCEGELVQQRNCGNFDLSEQKYFEIISRKTGALLAGSIVHGVRLAGADEAICVKAREVGIDFGLAFQIMDDVRDIISPVDESGKTGGTDFLQGKLTLPLIHHISCVGGEAVEFISSNASVSYSKDVQQELVKRLNSTGSLEYACEQAVSYMQSVRQFVDRLPGKKAVQAFTELADMVLAR